jgi:hypothetical protein
LTFGIPRNERFSVKPLSYLITRQAPKRREIMKPNDSMLVETNAGPPVFLINTLSCWETVRRANRHNAWRTQYLSQTLTWRDRRQDPGASCLWRDTSHRKDLPCPVSGGCDRHADDS